MAKQRHADRAPDMAPEPAWEPHMPLARGPGRRMTYEEFLDWADEDTVAEWVDGEIIMPSPASERHQEINSFLLALLRGFNEVHRLGTILPAPFQMKITRSGREPDLLYLAAEHHDRLKGTYLDGPADLVIEIVSPESAERDRVAKFAEYQAAAIPEYWLIDPMHETADFYQLDDQGRYQAVFPDARGLYHARALSSFALRVDWLWRPSLPAVTDALLDVDGDAYVAYLRERMHSAGR